MKLIVRQMVKEDYEAYKGFFDEACNEYLEDLSQNDPQQYRKERQENRIVTRARFNFYLKTGSSFVAEKGSEVVGYVATQTIPYMRGHSKVLQIEYVIVKSKFRRQGAGASLLRKLAGYANASEISQVFSTISPDNEASIKLHERAGFNIKNWKIASLRIGD